MFLRGSRRIAREEFGLCYFLCYCRPLNPASNKGYQNRHFYQYFTLFCSRISNPKKSPENAKNTILSPVRLPFRHTGILLTAMTYNKFPKLD